MKKNFINFISKLQNNNTENEIFGEQSNVIKDSSTFDFTRNQNVPEQYCNSDIKTLRIKNIFKIGTPLPLEPSLYSPIHLLKEEKKN